MRRTVMLTGAGISRESGPDLEPSPERSRFGRSTRGPATVALPDLVAELLDG